MSKQQAAPRRVAAAEDDMRRCRVLIVDDSALQRRMLGKVLSKLDYEVREAASGAEALALCEVWQPELIISDWMMPQMSGLELCRALRARDDPSFTYFILLTSKSTKDEIATGLHAGADDFLIKPVDTIELQARMTAGSRIVTMQRELAAKNRLVNDTLEELQRVYDLLDDDLIEAKRLQHSLLPDRTKDFAQGSLSLMLQSAGHVGGDLVGFFRSDDDKLCLFAIDVSGHGISSALMTARLAGNLSGQARDQNLGLQKQADGQYHARSPAQVAQALNALVLNDMETEHYLTMLLAFVELGTGKTTLTQAGHPHPILQKPDGQIEKLGVGGFPVGLVGGIQYDEFDVTLTPGDRLLLFSDGVMDCGVAKDGGLGEAGLHTILSELSDISGPPYFDALLWALSDYAGEDGFGDDISGVMFEYRGTDQAMKR